MFLSDIGGGQWKFPAKIERASMDGSMRTVLVNHQLVDPVGLSVDQVNQRIYWADASMDHIQTVTYTGQNRLELGMDLELLR